MRCQITFDAELPAGTTIDDARKWASFWLREVCQMDKSPASDTPFEAVKGTVIVREAE